MQRDLASICNLELTRRAGVRHRPQSAGGTGYRRTFVLLVASFVTACGLGSGPPSSGPTDDAGVVQDLFSREVVPIFESHCGSSACHAAAGDSIDTLDETYFLFPVDASGKITGAGAVAIARERAMRTLSPEGAQFSTLVRKPLDESLGGLAHAVAPSTGRWPTRRCRL